MKSWDEVRNGMTVYIRDSIEVYEDDIIIGNTKPFQEAYVYSYDKDYVTIFVTGGEFDGYDFYWNVKEDKSEELLTEEEYNILDISEKIIWFELNKYLKKINVLKEKSQDILTVKTLIERNNI